MQAEAYYTTCLSLSLSLSLSLPLQAEAYYTTWQSKPAGKATEEPTLPPPVASTNSTWRREGVQEDGMPHR